MGAILRYLRLFVATKALQISNVRVRESAHPEIQVRGRIHAPIITLIGRCRDTSTSTPTDSSHAAKKAQVLRSTDRCSRQAGHGKLYGIKILGYFLPFEFTQKLQLTDYTVLFSYRELLLYGCRVVVPTTDPENPGACLITVNPAAKGADASCRGGPTDFELFHRSYRYTDDTVCTAAIAHIIVNDRSLAGDAHNPASEWRASSCSSRLTHAVSRPEPSSRCRSVVKLSISEIAARMLAAAKPMEILASGYSFRCWPKLPTDRR